MQSPLKLITESRTYQIFNFRSLPLYALQQYVAQVLEDYSNDFELKVLQSGNWITITDETYETHIINSVSPLVYINYWNTPSIIRVQTYNLATAAKHSNWDVRIHKIAQQIKNANPDIIGIQEACRNPNLGADSMTNFISKIFGSSILNKARERNMLDELLELLPEYPYHYSHESMIYKNGSTEGIAIISRYPIIDVRTAQLTKALGDSEERACLKVTIKHPKKIFSVFNTHMTYDPKGQLKQAQDILNFMNEENDGTPQILLGDMNIRKYYELPSRLLEGKYLFKSSKGGLIDSWKNGNMEGDGLTFPSWRPKERLDRIYFRNIEAPPICEVCGYGESEKIWASDHCSVYADFILSIC
ncbi:unnamed protein product [Blepharisma stoltei]|uniref:Endonuclease/exonuclease/phosphatase domain-containing protein n=1 Tax=Blepharisma stoltei TaxID=1481888 RepID=A0AAU9IU23_9CILI|nr:unnamed protein product [Blepharisma stoltei]